MKAEKVVDITFMYELKDLPPMKNPLHYIQSHPNRCVAMMGLSYDNFKQLLEQAKLAHHHHQEEKEKQKIRVNLKGGGRRTSLSIDEGVCLTLFYLRQPQSFEVLGLNFGVSKTTANDTFHYWLMILRCILPASLLEQVERNGDDLDKILQELEEYRLLVDSFEQDRERPLDNDIQKKYYSGKKKRHTFKNQPIGLPKGEDIIDITVGKRGPESDITLFRVQQNNFSEKQLFAGDKAYIGEENILTPHKKPKNGELTALQKEENRVFSSSRIFIEHLIRRIRIFAISRVRFPLKSACYSEVILTVCGLVRLNLGTLEYSSI